MWGYVCRDLRAELEVAISRVYHLAQQSEGTPDGDYTSDCEDAPSIYCNQALTAAVRKDLATAIGSLLEHGLVNVFFYPSLKAYLKSKEKDTKNEIITTVYDFRPIQIKVWYLLWAVFLWKD